MFDNFVFEKRDKEVVGYHFPCENPKAVLCIIHGVGEYAARYSRMANLLKERGIAVVSMDLRGHGISKGKRGDAAPREEVLKDVDALIEYATEFYKGAPIVLYGHSMGGNICLDYKARGMKNTVPAKYIVSAPWVKLCKDIPKPAVKVLRGISKIKPKMQISQSFPEEDLGNPIYVRPYSSNPLVHNKITLRCAVECFDIGNSIYDGTNYDNNGSQGKPFLLMHGDMDKICAIEGSRAVASRLYEAENFKYIEWPGYFHEIHNGGRGATGEDVIKTIGDFILKD